MPTTIVFAVAFIYSYFLISIESKSAFSDRWAYEMNFDNAEIYVIQFFSEFNFSSIFNEPLYYPFIFFLKAFYWGDNYVELLIFLTSFFFSFTLLNYAKKEWSFFIMVVIFLLFPFVLKNYVIHLRQGLAMSLFYFGFYSDSKKLKFLIYVSPLIHGTFLPIVLVYFILQFKSYFRLYYLYFLLTILSLFLLSNSESITKLNNLSDYSSDASGIGFAIWFVLLLILFYLKFHEYNSFFVILLIIYLSSYFFYPSFSSRTFESSLPLVLFSLNKRFFEYRIFFLFFLFFGVTLYIINPLSQW
jgi:hypothetical protein